MTKHMLLCLHHQSKVVSSPGICQALACLCQCLCMCDWLWLWWVSSQPIYIFRESVPLHHPFLYCVPQINARAGVDHVMPLRACVCFTSCLFVYVCVFMQYSNRPILNSVGLQHLQEQKRKHTIMNTVRNEKNKQTCGAWFNVVFKLFRRFEVVLQYVVGVCNSTPGEESQSVWIILAH